MIAFSKYQGTGNDFILVDDRNETFPSNNIQLIQRLCNRKFGIGSDGLILLRNGTSVDFEMIFFNPDGSKSFCGNGSRCAVRFAERLGMIKDEASFLAFDGPHLSSLQNNHVSVKMADCVYPNLSVEDGYYLNTGSPHYVKKVVDIQNFDVLNVGRAIRNNLTEFGTDGTNANFIEEQNEGSIFVRTYERGVENETLSCGTGVTACAIVHGVEERLNKVQVNTKGGELEIRFSTDNSDVISDIYLTGPANWVFDGKIET